MLTVLNYRKDKKETWFLRKQGTRSGWLEPSSGESLLFSQKDVKEELV
jgi:hypothetical protein